MKGAYIQNLPELIFTNSYKGERAEAQSVPSVYKNWGGNKLFSKIPIMRGV